MTIAERNNKLKHFITCLKCEVSGKVCDDNCSTQYDAGNMGEIIENLEAISKALEQEPRWIPTSERLPEEDGEYYATIYDIDENYQYMDIAELEDGIWQYKDYIKVLAWMPLPKPYSEV